MPNASRTINSKQLTINKKVKLSAIIFLLLFSLITHHFSLTLAQQSPLNEAKANYTAQLTKYNIANENYITAKSNYISFQTASAKGEAFTKTKEYLSQVDELLLVYMRLVEEYGENSKWQNASFDKSTLDGVLDEQIILIEDHKNQVQQTETLEQLPPLAKGLKEQLDNSTIPKINKIIVTFDIAQTEYVFSRFGDVSQSTSDFVQTRINPANNTLFLNWQSEIADIKDKTANNLDLAKQNHQKIKEDKNNSFQIKQTNQIIQRAKDELKRSKNLFEEMLRVI